MALLNSHIPHSMFASPLSTVNCTSATVTHSATGLSKALLRDIREVCKIRQRCCSTTTWQFTRSSIDSGKQTESGLMCLSQ